MGIILTMLQFPNPILEEYLKYPTNFEKDLQSGRTKHFKQAIDTGKAWEAIHYLVTGNRLDIMLGKTKIKKTLKPLSLFIYCDQYFDRKQSLGLGPASYVTPEQVKQIHTILDPLNKEYLKSKFNSIDMKSKKIYPPRMEWNENDFEYVCNVSLR